MISSRNIKMTTSSNPRAILQEINRHCDDIVTNHNRDIAFGQPFIHILPSEYATGVVNRLTTVFPMFNFKFTIRTAPTDKDNLSTTLLFEPIVKTQPICATAR